MATAAKMTGVTPKAGEATVVAAPGTADLFAAMIAGMAPDGGQAAATGQAPAGEEPAAAIEPSIEPDGAPSSDAAATLPPLLGQQPAVIPPTVLIAPGEQARRPAAGVDRLGENSRPPAAGETGAGRSSRRPDAAAPSSGADAPAPGTKVQTWIQTPPEAGRAIPAPAAKHAPAASLPVPGEGATVPAGAMARQAAVTAALPAGGMPAEAPAPVPPIAAPAPTPVVATPGASSNPNEAADPSVASAASQPAPVRRAGEPAAAAPPMAEAATPAPAAVPAPGKAPPARQAQVSAPVAGPPPNPATPPADAFGQAVRAFAPGKPATKATRITDAASVPDHAARAARQGAATDGTAGIAADIPQFDAGPSAPLPPAGEGRAAPPPFQAAAAAPGSAPVGPAPGIAAANLGAAISAQVLDLTKGSAWIDQLARDISRTAAHDGAMRFRLAPETLGELKVEITHSERGAHIRLAVASEAAQQALSLAEPKLVAEARAQGVRIAETEVSLGGGQGQQLSERQAQSQSHGRNEPPARSGAPHGPRGGVDAAHSDPAAPEGRRRNDRYA